MFVVARRNRMSRTLQPLPAAADRLGPRWSSDYRLVAADPAARPADGPGDAPRVRAKTTRPGDRPAAGRAGGKAEAKLANGERARKMRTVPMPAVPVRPVLGPTPSPPRCSIGIS